MESLEAKGGEGKRKLGGERCDLLGGTGGDGPLAAAVVDAEAGKDGGGDRLCRTGPGPLRRGEVGQAKPP